jgi:hypothetical protein
MRVKLNEEMAIDGLDLYSLPKTNSTTDCLSVIPETILRNLYPPAGSLDGTLGYYDASTSGPFAFVYETDIRSKIEMVEKGNVDASGMPFYAFIVCYPESLDSYCPDIDPTSVSVSRIWPDTYDFGATLDPSESYISTFSTTSDVPFGMAGELKIGYDTYNQTIALDNERSKLLSRRLRPLILERARTMLGTKDDQGLPGALVRRTRVHMITWTDMHIDTDAALDGTSYKMPYIVSLRFVSNTSAIPHGSRKRTITNTVSPLLDLFISVGNEHIIVGEIASPFYFPGGSVQSQKLLPHLPPQRYTNRYSCDCIARKVIPLAVSMSSSPFKRAVLVGMGYSAWKLTDMFISIDARKVAEGNLNECVTPQILYGTGDTYNINLTKPHNNIYPPPPPSDPTIENCGFGDLACFYDQGKMTSSVLFWLILGSFFVFCLIMTYVVILRHNATPPPEPEPSEEKKDQ